MSLVIVDVHSDSEARKSEMSDSLRTRLTSKRTRRSKGQLADRLGAAEARRQQRIEAVKQRAIDSRPTVNPDFCNSFASDSAASYGLTSDHGGLTPPSPPFNALSTSWAQSPPTLQSEMMFSSSASPEFWRMTHSLCISVWDDVLRKASFQTEIVDLHPRLAAALVADTPGALPATLKEEFTALEMKLGKAIAAVGGEAFIKLSSRSGKDDFLLRCGGANGQDRCALLHRILRSNGLGATPAASPRADPEVAPCGESFDSLDLGAFMEECEAEMGGVTANGLSEVAQANIEAVSVLQTASCLMMQTDGRDALRHLAGSARVATDLKKSLQASNDIGRGMLVMVREFSRNIAPDTEWRVFVHNRRVTAISQYHHHCYFENHPRNCEEQITTFVGTLLGSLPLASCVVDVALTEAGCTLIELNPFHHSTDGCLFDWCGSDVNVLLGEGGGVTFRRRHAPLPAKQVRKNISRAYRHALDSFWFEEESGSNLLSPPRHRDVPMWRPSDTEGDGDGDGAADESDDRTFTEGEDDDLVGL